MVSGDKKFLVFSFFVFGRIERQHSHNPEPLLGGHSKTGVLHIREIQLLLTADVFGADHSLLGVDMVIFWTRSSLTSGNQQALPLKKQLQKETRTLLRCAFGLVLQNTFAFSKISETMGNRQNAAPQRLSPECLHLLGTMCTCPTCVKVASAPCRESGRARHSADLVPCPTSKTMFHLWAGPTELNSIHVVRNQSDLALRKGTSAAPSRSPRHEQWLPGSWPTHSVRT